MSKLHLTKIPAEYKDFKWAMQSLRINNPKIAKIVSYIFYVFVFRIDSLLAVGDVSLGSHNFYIYRSAAK